MKMCSKARAGEPVMSNPYWNRLMPLNIVSYDGKEVLKLSDDSSN